MPKIPTYTARGQITTETPSVQTTIQAPIPTIAGEIQSTLAKYYVAEKKEEAKIKSAEYENESWNELYNIFDKHKNNPYPTDATNNFQRDTEAYKQNFLNTRLAGESKFTRDAWLQKFESNKSSTLLVLNKNARNNLENKNQEQFETFASSMSTRLRLDSSYAAKVNLEIDNKVSEIEDQFVREEKRKFLINIKDATILDVNAKNNPMGLLQQLKENPELYSNIPDEKEKAIISAQNKIQEMNEEYLNQTVSQIIKDTPFGQQADTIALLEDSVKKFFVNPKDQAKAKTLAESIFKQKRQTIIEKGGAEYFINNDSKINQAYNESLTNPNDFKTFVQILDKKYDEQKIPNEYRTYLPINKVNEIKDIIQGTTGSAEKLNVISQIKNLYGDKMPLINQQIDKQIGRGISLAISTNDPIIQKYSALGNLSDEEKKSARSKVNDENIEENLLKKIRENLAPFANIYSNQPEGVSREYGKDIEGTITSIKNVAMRGILENEFDNIKDAADILSEGFLRDYNVSNETFYIPSDVNGKPVVSDFIEAKASVFETKLYWNNINLENFNVDPIGQGGNFLSKQETIDLFKKNGHWYMDGNKGIKFGIKESFGGFTPMKINGENVTINFLDYDGEFSSMKDVNGNSYIMDMTDIYNFISAEFEGAESP
jgi:uncharacterized protein YkvS